MSSLTPVLAELLEAAVEGKTRNLRVALPGRIEKYDPATRRATVQVVVQDGYVDGDGERQTVTIPAMTDVPVLMTGSGSVRVKFPIKPGSQCWVMFSSSSIARVKSTDGTDVVDPADDRRHHEADAVAIPVPSLGAASADDDAMIEFTDDGLIKAGGDNPLVTKHDFDTHTHPVATTGSATAQTGTAAPPTVPAVGTPKLRG